MILSLRYPHFSLETRGPRKACSSAARSSEATLRRCAPRSRAVIAGGDPRGWGEPRPGLDP